MDGKHNVRGITQNEKDFILQVDRTVLLDAAYQQLMEGKNHIPKTWRYLCDSRWGDEMCTPTRVLEEDTGGRKRYLWKSPDADHQRHADAYDFLAGALYYRFDLTKIIGEAQRSHEEEEADTQPVEFDELCSRVRTGLVPRRMPTLR